MGQPVFGLWIVPDYEAEKPRFKGDGRICYKTHIGQFEKNSDGLFVTNPVFRQWIRENPQWIGKPLGEIELFIREKEKKIGFMWFYPFGEDKITVKGKEQHPEEIFGKKGIGAFAFFRVLNEAKKMFPDYKVGLGTTPTRYGMRPMLARMGWKMPYKYKISTGTKRARDYVARAMRQHKKR